MIHRLVDNVLGIAKESIKTVSQESFNTAVRCVNGFSALLLAVLPAKSSLEGIQGWELRPTLRGPRLPSWMEEGVSSFNSLIHDYESDCESEYESEYESGLDDESLPPSSPCSTTSHVSRVSSYGRHRRHGSFVKRMVRKLFWPLRVWSSRPTSLSTPRGSFSVRNSSTGSFHRMYKLARCQISGVKDYMMPKQTGDHRRGIIEDLQLVIQLSIERMFEVVRSYIYYCLSPFQTFKQLLRWIFLSDSNPVADDVVDTATLGDSNPAPQKQVKNGRTLNTDGRTCEDVITSLGYPYEALRVVTGDGYVLHLERIPRPNSQKVLYLQHGLLDSSLGWVSSGVVGSQAFAAYDQGYDVFLGNFRGLASKEHVNRNISAQRYWRYSVNEHGTQDIPAMLTKIHEIKTSDLKDIKDDVSMCNPVNSHGERLPYSLCGVAHSLGGASILMYVVTRRLEEKPHYLSRLVLLSPAGFHEEAPLICWVLKHVIPIFAPILGPLIPGLYIPTRFLRGLFNKLARDFQNYPAVGGLVQTVLSYLVGGDSSNWVGAIGMSHYNMNDMPGISFLVAQHLAQMMHFKKFTMFDFGSGQANFEAYGTRNPLDIGAHYGVIDIPVDFVAGLKDKLIPRSMVRKHYEMLKGAGGKASYDEFEYAHLDFTFSHREELQAYVMSRLLLVKPPQLMSGVSPQQTIGKAKSMKKLTSSLPTKKPFKKPTIIVNNSGEVEDKEVVRESLGNPNQHGSRNGGQNGDDSFKAFHNLEDNPPFALASTVQAEIESIHEHNQEILSTVTAGSVATESHEESCLSDTQPVEPQSFDDSSLFAFPSKELVSIMSKRVSRGGLLRGTSISEYNIERGFDTSSKVGENVTRKLDSSKEFRKSTSTLSRITSGLFRRSSTT